MDTSAHDLKALFEQLGLPSSEEYITRFMHEHSPLDPEVKLVDWPFWNPGQRSFLIEALADDSDWTEQVEHLDAETLVEIATSRLAWLSVSRKPIGRVGACL